MKQIRSRSFFYTLVVFSLIFSASGLTPIPAAHAQSEETATPTPFAISTPDTGNDTSADTIPTQVVIEFAADTTDQERTAYINSVDGTVVENIEALDTVVLRVPASVADDPLPQSSLVEESEQDYYISALDDEVPPNDLRYNEQWALPAIGAPSAWSQLPANAPKVTVAVIDSGICAANPDLTGRIVEGWDFLGNDAVPQDDFGHGCSVSGIIAANMNDGVGIAGVAPNAQIMPLRVLNANGVGSYSDVAAAIVYAADNGAQVINLSLGGSNSSSVLEDAVNYAVSKGVIIVAAAGNSGTEGALYPAAYPDVIAVGSVDPNLQHSSFSNYGSQVDIWAPGRDILTTKRDGSYGLVSGTSFAAPYVASAEAINKIINLHITYNGLLISLDGQNRSITTPIITTTSLAIATVTPSNTPIEVPSEIYNVEFTDPYWGFNISYPSNWKLHNNPYNDFGWRIYSPDLEMDPLGMPISGGYLAINVFKSNNENLQMQDDDLYNATDVSSIQTLFSGYPATQTSGTTYYGIRYKLIILQDNGWVYKIKAMSDENAQDSIFSTTDLILSSIQIIKEPVDYPYNPTDTLQSLAFSFPAIKLPFQPGIGKIGWAYLDGDHQGSETFAFDLIECTGSVNGECGQGQTEQYILAPTDMTLRYSGNFNNISGDADDYHIFEITNDSSNRLCLYLSHFYIKHPQLTRDKRVPRGTVIGQLSSYSPSYPHIHMGLWSTPISSGCAGSSRTAIAFYGSYQLDGVDYPPASGYSGRTVTSTNSPVCAQASTLDINPLALSDCWGNTPTPPPTQTPVPPQGTINGLKLISVSSPTVQKGQTFAASITYEVVSGQLLQSRGDHLFGSDPTYGAWPVQAVNGTVNPGQQVTFSFNLTAPQQTGTFESKWRLKIGGNLIGPEAVVRFAVQDTSSPPTNSGPWNSQAWQNRYLAGNPNWSGQWTWSDNYPYVNFNWGTGAPFGWGGNEFSMRLWKTIHFPGGYYSFHASHDDGVKVYLDNTVILDAWWDGNGGHDIGKDIPAGDHEVKVEYYENTGDAFVNVYWYGPGFPEPDTNPPDGHITSPANYSATAASPLEITADASDDVSGVNRVEFYANYCDGSCGWRLISTDYSMPYSTSWDWSALGDQHVQLTTHMIDNTGKLRNDPGGYVEVDLDRTKPTISIISPVDGASLNGDPITITANASDSLSGIWKLQFFAGYNESVGAGALSMIDPPLPASMGDTGELSASDVSTQGWHEIGWDENGADGWSLSWTPTVVPNQSGISLFIYAYDHAGNIQGVIHSNLTLFRQQPVDILFNGGFEAGAVDPFGWQKDAWTLPYSTFDWNSDFARSGSKSIKISSPTANDARWIQTVYVQPNSDYRLSGWIMTDNVAHTSDPVDSGANLSVLDGSINYTTPLFGDNPWTYVSLEFNTGSNTYINIAARLGMYSGTTTGWAWFDDLKLELLSPPANPIEQKTFQSMAINDGYVLESTETSKKGGSMNSTATVLRVGDGVGDRQYRSILHFNTSVLPDNAVISSVELKIKKQGTAGANPFGTHQNLLVDIRKPSFGTALLQLTDFQSAANLINAGIFGTTPVSNWYTASFNSTAYPYINKTGTTQFRLRFNLDDNDDNGADYLKFYSGNAGATSKPKLIIYYYIPYP